MFRKILWVLVLVGIFGVLESVHVPTSEGRTGVNQYVKSAVYCAVDDEKLCLGTFSDPLLGDFLVPICPFSLDTSELFEEEMFNGHPNALEPGSCTVLILPG